MWIKLLFSLQDNDDDEEKHKKIIVAFNEEMNSFQQGIINAILKSTFFNTSAYSPKKR